MRISPSLIKREHFFFSFPVFLGPTELWLRIRLTNRLATYVHNKAVDWLKWLFYQGWRFDTLILFFFFLLFKFSFRANKEIGEGHKKMEHESETHEAMFFFFFLEFCCYFKSISSHCGYSNFCGETGKRFLFKVSWTWPWML